jgi:hypothetical protein
MKNLINRRIRLTERQSMIPRFSRMHLTRTFVETGDERCPIAGIWSRLENDATADEAESGWLAMWRLLPWRAFLFAAHFAVVH